MKLDTKNPLIGYATNTYYSTRTESLKRLFANNTLYQKFNF